MKHLFTLCASLLLSAFVFAQAPPKMSYQAVIRNSSDALITSSPVGMRISILQGSVTGTAVYVETQTPSTNANGLVSIEIGTGTIVTGTFAGINWATGPYFIKTESDPNGGTSYTISGTNQLMSVPYALHAKTAESVIGGGSGGVSFTHYVGEKFGGGVIFHLWKDSSGFEHGLIVDKTDLNTAQVWSNIDNSSIGSSAQSSWDGLNNSGSIVSQAGHTSSASALCLNSTNGGQSDWYLPSVDELSLLWHSRFNVNKSLSTIGGATVLPYSYSTAYYWSSTEIDAYNGWTFAFWTGNTIADSKFKMYYVRAVRAF